MRQIAALNIHRVELDFAAILQQQASTDQSHQQRLLATLSKQFGESVQQSSTLSQCETLATSEIRFVLALAQSRLQLLDALPSSSVQYKGSFSQFVDGNNWYRHWLRSWLHADVPLDELESIALSELDDARRKREQLAESDLPEDHSVIKGDDADSIVRAFKQREVTVYQHLPQVLATAYQAPKVTIVKSGLPKDFPAPGIYNAATQQFIYHLHDDNLPAKHLDWLFLHEGVPGHHYQSQFLQNNAQCPDFLGLQGALVFAEGWAAYIETLGSELGLFIDQSSAHYALDWQALRAVRVLIDIGIHAKGWDNERAEKEWLTHIPEQKSVMAREINRIRRWPAQVITYVYGKAMILQTIDIMQQRYPDKSLADIHQEILSLSNFSLKALPLKGNT
ncbi:DUF885 family protein [Aliiglaciecola sp. CAU 1673]|uniref:DUF885 family protein n=1 Tax=Aliiglaciecola sp. CAU 1673 TaxID=3032595 RepID=UPI0023DA7E8A|nr:DUF885 family protein [Aliiglaciecola sp. CAU 1673]MDF2177482.1 DUF885 family protein [Aliiglaciecola sp. CAU 1673]